MNTETKQINNNTGYENSGRRNSGDWNFGDYNSGDRSFGSRNSGHANFGYWNTGSWNSGDWNSGSWNSGGRNSGDWNSGSWNSGDWNSGYFNTTREPLRMFNRLVENVKREDIDFPDFLFFKLTEWIDESDMTQEEKEANPTFKTTGGYLKVYDYKEAFQKSWEKADKKDREKLFRLPNFDADIFYEISGIDVRKKETIKIGGKEYEVTDELKKALNNFKEVKNDI